MRVPGLPFQVEGDAGAAAHEELDRLLLELVHPLDQGRAFEGA